MEIRKIFSSYDNYGYEDSRVYSVLMSEEELTIFSEVQKEFGKLDLQEAKKLGTTVAKLRQSRVGIGKATGTVHDSINLRTKFNTGKPGYYAPGTPYEANQVLLRESRGKSGKLSMKKLGLMPREE